MIVNQTPTCQQQNRSLSRGIGVEARGGGGTEQSIIFAGEGFYSSSHSY